MFDLTLINLTLVQELLKGEGEKSSKENIDIIYFSYTKNLTHFQENKIRITFSQHLFFMFIQKFQRVTTFFFRVQLKKKQCFFYRNICRIHHCKKKNPMQSITILYTYIATLSKKDLQLALIYPSLVRKENICLCGKFS